MVEADIEFVEDGPRIEVYGWILRDTSLSLIDSVMLERDSRPGGIYFIENLSYENVFDKFTESEEIQKIIGVSRNETLDEIFKDLPMGKYILCVSDKFKKSELQKLLDSIKEEE